MTVLTGSLPRDPRRVLASNAVRGGFGRSAAGVSVKQGISHPAPQRRSTLTSIRLFSKRHGLLLWVSLFALLALAFVWRQQAEVVQIGQAAGAADRRWLLLIVLVNLLVVSSAGLSYRIVLRRLGHHVPWRACVGIHLQRHVVGTITPIGGPASIYVLIRALGRRGVPSTDALLVTTIRSAVGYTSFIMLLIPALALQRPSTLVLTGAGMLLALLIVVLGLLALLLCGRPLPAVMQRRLPAYLVRFVSDARAHGVRPRDLTAPLVLALANNLAGAFAVFLALRALGFEAGIVAGLVGYAIGNLFQIVAPVFQGLGVVELTMALALQHQGIPMSGAVAATLIYRLGDVWFLLGLGLLVQSWQQRAVRRVVRHAAPIAAGILGSVLLLAVPHGPITASLLFSESPSPYVSGLVGIVILLASVGFIGASAGIWTRRVAAQVVPLSLLSLAVPLYALANAGVSVPVPF
jgi:uncharacterized protein (TIRG00374 family)